MTPEWRLEQAVTETNAVTMKNMGDVIKWVQKDIIKEEQSLFRETTFTIKDINPFVSKIVVDWYKELLTKEALK